MAIPAWPTTGTDNIPYTKKYITGRTWTPSDVLSTPTVAGTTYYVDGAVGASGDGLTVGAAKKTIDEGLLLLSAGGGDRLLIRGAHDAFDGVYRVSTVRITKSCTIGPYNGETVIIDGGETGLGTWTDLGEGNNIWYVEGFSFAQNSAADSSRGSVVVDWKIYYKETTLDKLRAAPNIATSDTDEYVATNQRWASIVAEDRLYIRTPSDPNSLDVGVIQHNRNAEYPGLIYIDGQGGALNNVTVYGLTLRFAPAYAIITNEGTGNSYSNTLIDHCQSLYSSAGGIFLGKATSSTIRYCFSFSDCMDDWPRASFSCNSGGGWGAGIVLRNCSSSIIERCVSQFTHGEAFNMLDGGLHSAGTGNICRYNYAYSPMDNCYYNDNDGYDTYDGNYAYILAPSTNWFYALNDICGAGKQASCESSFGRPIGLAGGSENHGSNSRNLTFSNNVIIYPRHAWINPSSYGPMINNTICNNTFVLPPSTGEGRWRPFEGEGYGLWFQYNASNSGTVFYNNIIIQNTSGKTVATYIDGNTTVLGVDLNYNLFYIAGGSPFLWDTTPHNYTHAGWVTQSTYGANDVTDSPGLPGQSAVTGAVTDWIPPKGSAAINAGVTVATVTADFYGVVRAQGVAYDLGAFEYQSPTTTPLGIEGGQPGGMPGGKVDGI